MDNANKVYNLKERSYQYALATIRFLEKLPTDSVTRTISKQLLRSATSVGANIMEAKSATSKKDFANFYAYALKSANESTFWLNLLQDAGKASPELSAPLHNETKELSNILAASVLTMKGKRNA